MHQNRASRFASDFYRRRGYRKEFRSEDHFYPFSSQKKSRFASDFLCRGNRASWGLKKSRDFFGERWKSPPQPQRIARFWCTQDTTPWKSFIFGSRAYMVYTLPDLWCIPLSLVFPRHWYTLLSQGNSVHHSCFCFVTSGSSHRPREEGCRGGSVCSFCQIGGRKTAQEKKNKFLGTEVPRNFSDQCSLDFACFLCVFSGRRAKSSQELCSWELFFLILGGFSLSALKVREPPPSP